jgi:acyl carrier protein
MMTHIKGVPEVDSKLHQDVEIKVRKIIADSLCVDLEDVTLKSNLIRDLGAESIDFLDIMFRLEKDFSIKIPQREIEKQARGGLAAEEFEVDSILQEKGALRLRELLPEIPPQDIKAGMSLRELPAAFTVEVFVNIVRRKIDGTLWTASSTDATTTSEL